MIDTSGVNVTPELLEMLSDVALAGSAPAPAVLALVSRIRSLEQGIREAIAEHDEQAELWGDEEFHGDPEHAEYHRQRGDLLRGYLG